MHLDFFYGTLFASPVLIQPNFYVGFQRGSTFSFWFALTAIIVVTASILNAKLANMHGMRAMVLESFTTQVVLPGLVLMELRYALYFTVL